VIIIFSSSIPITPTNKSIPCPETINNYGAFVLTCTNIEGIKDDYYIGGLSDLNITATTLEFLLATFPIWGTTIIDYETEVHITIENFFGVIEKNNYGYVEVMGICRNIEWELI
jgi:hypothetical protein